MSAPVNRQFYGFRSAWTMPLSWMASNAKQISRKNFHKRDSPNSVTPKLKLLPSVTPLLDPFFYWFCMTWPTTTDLAISLMRCKYPPKSPRSQYSMTIKNLLPFTEKESMYLHTFLCRTWHINSFSYSAGPNIFWSSCSISFIAYMWSLTIHT